MFCRLFSARTSSVLRGLGLFLAYTFYELEWVRGAWKTPTYQAWHNRLTNEPRIQEAIIFKAEEIGKAGVQTIIRDSHTVVFELKRLRDDAHRSPQLQPFEALAAACVSQFMCEKTGPRFQKRFPRDSNIIALLGPHALDSEEDVLYGEWVPGPGLSRFFPSSLSLADGRKYSWRIFGPF